MSDEAAAVSLAGVSKVFERGNTHALDDITLELRPGELVSLIGPSGCGKSTMLRVIADLIEPTSGTITVAGKSAQWIVERPMQMDGATLIALPAFGSVAFAEWAAEGDLGLGEARRVTPIRMISRAAVLGGQRRRKLAAATTPRAPRRGEGLTVKAAE